MHPRSTWTLVMVALGMFAFILFFERYRNPQPPPPGPLLPELSLSAVTSIQVRPGDQAPLIRVERTNDTWQLTQPFAYPVEVHRVRALLQALNSLTRQQQIDNEQLRTHKNPQQEYGFESPQFAITVEQGDRKQQLLVGHSTRTGDEVFLQVVGSVGIFLANAQLLKFLPKTPNDWRALGLIPQPEPRVDGITITNAGRVISLVRDATNRNWRMTVPLPCPANSERIESYLQELLNVPVTQFVNDDPLADLTPYGLRPPGLELTLTQGTNTLMALSFGNSPPSDTSQIYARRRDPPGVVLVPRAPVDLWRLNYEDYRKRRLVQLSETSVDRIEVQGEGAFVLDRTSNQVWRVTSPENLPADPELVRAFLGLLNNLRIARFVQEFHAEGYAQQYGFAPPVRSFTFSKSDTNATDGRRVVARLDFGGQSEDRELIYVRQTEEASNPPLEKWPIYAVSWERFKDLPPAGWHLRDRIIWQFATNEVAKITVRHDGKMIEILREAAGGRWVLGPGASGRPKNFSSLGVDYTLDNLGHLRAHDIWLDRGPDAAARYGITEKSLSIELELAGEPAGRKLKVDLRKTPGSDWPLAATTLDNQVYIFAFPAGTYLQILDCLDPAPGSP